MYLVDVRDVDGSRCMQRCVFLGGNARSEIEEKVDDCGKMKESGCACLQAYSKACTRVIFFAVNF